MTQFLEKLKKPYFWPFWAYFANLGTTMNFHEKLDFVSFYILQLPTTM